MKNRLFIKILSFLVIIYIVFCFINLSINTNKNFWDFKIYYLSSKCLVHNSNPYSAEDISKMDGTRWDIHYVYPPLTLTFFQLFNIKSFCLAANIFLALKAILLLIMFFIWRNILEVKHYLLFLIFALLAFNSAIYLDLSSGNVTIIVQFLLWTGFYFFLKRNYSLFCTFILLASCFKLVPVAFILLLLFTDNRKKYIFFIGSLFVFALYILLNYLFDPALFHEFTKAFMGTLNDRGGIVNPSLFLYIRDFFNKFFEINIGVDLFKALELLTYAVLVFFILGITIISLRKVYNKNHPLYKNRELLLIFFFCLIYSFIMPRFKDYDYILLIVPGYYIIRTTTFINPLYLLMFIFSISSVNITLPYVNSFYHLMWAYYPLFLAIALWMLYIYNISGASNCRKEIVEPDN